MWSWSILWMTPKARAVARAKEGNTYCSDEMYFYSGRHDYCHDDYCYYCDCDEYWIGHGG